MRKRINRPAIVLLLASVFLLANFADVSAQGDGAVYAVPQKLSLDRTVRRLFPRFYGGVPYQRLYTEGFFPIGWSRDGKFAYYIEPVDEACGCYYATLIIQDMRSDKVLWEFKYDQSDRFEGKLAPEDTIAKLWAKNRTLFSGKLREHAIEASRFTLLGKTFANGGRSYTAAAVAPIGRDDDGLARAKSVTLSFVSPKLGKKVLYSASYKGDMYTSPLDAGVAGIFKSPFEDRVAVVMIEVKRGYEGPPNTADVHIVGADLVNGFKK